MRWLLRSSSLLGTFVILLGGAMTQSVLAAGPGSHQRLLGACRHVFSVDPELTHLAITEAREWSIYGPTSTIYLGVRGDQEWEQGYVACIFSDLQANTPVLAEFFEATCGECGVAYGPERLAEANERLRAEYWPTANSE